MALEEEASFFFCCCLRFIVVQTRDGTDVKCVMCNRFNETNRFKYGVVGKGGLIKRSNGKKCRWRWICNRWAPLTPLRVAHVNQMQSKVGQFQKQMGASRGTCRGNCRKMIGRIWVVTDNKWHGMHYGSASVVYFSLLFFLGPWLALGCWMWWSFSLLANRNGIFYYSRRGLSTPYAIRFSLGSECAHTKNAIEFMQRLANTSISLHFSVF